MYGHIGKIGNAELRNQIAKKSKNYGPKDSREKYENSETKLGFMRGATTVNWQASACDLVQVPWACTSGEPEHKEA